MGIKDEDITKRKGRKGCQADGGNLYLRATTLIKNGDNMRNKKSLHGRGNDKCVEKSEEGKDGDGENG
ncbi:MAG: hypothetical protein IJR32_05185 [Paludibacteraceae bacterium]|nr:hypothetical protein [Paludibacteraceae bacterium]